MRQSPRTPLGTPLSRRRFLVASAGLAFAAACGNGGSRTSTDAPTTTAPGTAGGVDGLAQFFPPSDFAVTGSPQRLPVGIVIDGVPAGLDLAPQSITVQLRTGDADVGEPITVERHGQGLPRAYYPVMASFDSPGIYAMTATVEGTPIEASFQVAAATALELVGAGMPMPTVPTPTTADKAGVAVVCTRDPVCPLHSVSLDDALVDDLPIALLVSSPAFCQTQVCGPVLETLLSLVPEHEGKIRFIHVEPYADPRKPPSEWEAAPIMGALHLPYEPALFLVEAGGTVHQRLDVVFDAAEVAAALDVLVS